MATTYLVGQFGPKLNIGPPVMLAMSAAASVLLCLSGPVLERILLRHRRRLFVLDVDLNQSIYGRAVGVAAGVVLMTEWF